MKNSHLLLCQCWPLVMPGLEIFTDTCLSFRQLGGVVSPVHNLFMIYMDFLDMVQVYKYLIIQT